MKLFTSIMLIALPIFIQFSCGSKSKKPNQIIEKSETEFDERNIDVTLEQLKHFVEGDLENWQLSFKDFQIDSFRLVQETEFEQQNYDEASDLAKFYELYKPSLSFSPDSTRFIDLHSSGLMLRKEGKKIIASANVDQAISLCNLSVSSPFFSANVR